MIPGTGHKPEERAANLVGAKITAMVAGKYKVAKCVMGCSLRQVIIQI